MVFSTENISLLSETFSVLVASLEMLARQGRGEDSGSTGYFGGILMRWPWRRQGAIESRPMVSRAMELQTAKEILA